MSGRAERLFPSHAEEHGSVFENRIEDRKPLRVPRDVLGRSVGFREIRPGHFSKGFCPEEQEFRK